MWCGRCIAPQCVHFERFAAFRAWCERRFFVWARVCLIRITIVARLYQIHRKKQQKGRALIRSAPIPHSSDRLPCLNLCFSSHIPVGHNLPQITFTSRAYPGTCLETYGCPSKAVSDDSLNWHLHVVTDDNRTKMVDLFLRERQVMYAGKRNNDQALKRWRTKVHCHLTPFKLTGSTKSVHDGFLDLWADLTISTPYCHVPLPLFFPLPIAFIFCDR